MAEGERVRAMCYRAREWKTVMLPPQCRGGWEVALRRTRTLVHDAAGESIEYMLASAYLQGLMDGQQVWEAADLQIQEIQKEAPGL